MVTQVQIVRPSLAFLPVVSRCRTKHTIKSQLSSVVLVLLDLLEPLTIVDLPVHVCSRRLL